MTKEQKAFEARAKKLDDGFAPLVSIAGLFKEGAAADKGVLEVTGPGVAAFCDDLIKGSKTWADLYQ